MTTIPALDYFKGKDTVDLVSSFAALNPPAPAADHAEFAEAPGFKSTSDGLALLKRAKDHATRCGLPLAIAAARVDDPQLKAVDEWRADVQAYAKSHKCSLADARVAVPHPLA